MESEIDQAYAELLSKLRPATKLPAACQHLEFAAAVGVARLEDSGRFMCELRVCCVDCREPFRFKGIPPGLSFDRPTVSIDGLEAHLPIEPEGDRRLFSSASFEMPAPVPTGVES